MAVNDHPVPAFELRDAHVRFGATKAVDGVDLTIHRGEHLALIGPSGSGKTTLLRVLNGSQSLDSGTIRIHGEEIRNIGNRKLRTIRSNIGWIPQSLGLIPNLRVIQNVVLGASGRESAISTLRKLTFPSRPDQLRCLNHLERVGIGEKLFERLSNLSGGQQQRVAIARTLFQAPTSILADEPVSAVDPARAADLVKLLTDLASEEGVTLVMSIHNLALAREFFPRIVGLRRGNVVIDGSSDLISKEEFDELFTLGEQEMIDGE